MPEVMEVQIENSDSAHKRAPGTLEPIGGVPEYVTFCFNAEANKRVDRTEGKRDVAL
ncbi:hypothetical protein FEP08_05577 [Burkholderia multivorans]|nr:hypothetical protein [Burkholderia multivorans]